MKKIFVLIFSLILFSGVIFIQSCDKIDPPYIDGNNNIPDTVEVRKFLLEEFTGHTCPNCPEGAIVAQQLKGIYGERLIIISIHYADFAEPGSSPFTYDFRSSTGNEIGGFFQPSSFPAGMVSRTGWSTTINNSILDKDAWGSRIESLKNSPPTISIEIDNTWDSGTRTVDATVELDALTDIDTTYKIAVYITEDNIVKPQQTADTIAYSYVHKHVLRGSMNGTWGDTLIAGNASLGERFTKNFSSTLDADWNENNCYLVVLVFNAETYEIMQVEEKKIK